MSHSNNLYLDVCRCLGIKSSCSWSDHYSMLHLRNRVILFPKQFYYHFFRRWILWNSKLQLMNVIKFWDEFFWIIFSLGFITEFFCIQSSLEIGIVIILCLILFLLGFLNRKTIVLWVCQKLGCLYRICCRCLRLGRLSYLCLLWNVLFRLYYLWSCVFRFWIVTNWTCSFLRRTWVRFFSFIIRVWRRVF